MRILLAHNSLYFPSHGGGDKSNRLLMEALAAKGHTVRVVARMEEFGEAAHQQLISNLAERGVAFVETGEAVEFTLKGVDVRTLTRSTHLMAYFAMHIKEFEPDVIVTSTDDPAQLLFSVAIRSKARVVYLVRATIATPFGPDSSMPNAERATTLRQADGVVGVSEYVAQYARQWGGLDAVHVPISLMEQGASDSLGRFENQYVTMVNPCAVKGISIFLALAERMPELEFAAVPTWGTTPEEMEQLRNLPNVTLLPPVDDIAEILRQTRVMLVPSVWAEARSRMVMEAMLRGIPVMASDVGGLHEAKLGVPYLLPVNPIVQYHAALDRNMVPIADVPAQDVAPWVEALRRLTSDEQHWEAIASASREAALVYLKTLTVDRFETYLETLIQKPKKQITAALSEDKRRLLALRLRQRSWFPKCTPDERPRLFCFPHAGAGALVYRDWAVPGFAICAAQLPGREDRAAETPFVRMEDLIAELMGAIRPLVQGEFVLFGHSMGAGIAFELARALRRAKAPLPRALVLSGARAPQYRLHRTPPVELSDAELAKRVHASGIALLRADLKLYNDYTYTEEAPLPIPIFAYGSEGEPVDEWRVQTSASFKSRTFPGGHFPPRELLLAALAEDLNRL